MSKVASQETDRLMRAMAALSAAPNVLTDAGRLLSGQEAHTSLELLLSEVNETVLRRQLTFSDGGKTSFTVEVREKRLLKISCETPALGASGEQILNKELTQGDAAQTIKVLRKYCDQMPVLYVVSALVRGSDTGTYEGIPCADLRKLAMNHQRTPALDELRQAVEQSKSFAEALVVLVDGVSTTKHGDPDQIEALSDLSAKSSLQETSMGLRIWQGGLADDKFLGVITLSDCSIWIIASGQYLDRCIELWSGLITP